MPKAAAIVGEALAVADRSGNYDARVRALRVAAGVAVDAGDHEWASEASQRWLDLAIGAGDRREEAVAVVQSAWPLADSHRFAHALPVLDRAAAICREWNLTMIRAIIDVNAAEIWTKLGAFNKALELLDNAITFNSLGSTADSAGAESSFALALAHDGQTERATMVARKVMRGLESVDGERRRLASARSRTWPKPSGAVAGETRQSSSSSQP